MASTEGAPIPRLYGRVRLAGQVIWATASRRGRDDPHASAGRRQGRRRRRTTTTTTLQLLRQFRGRPVRRADRPRRAHLGRRQAARSHRHQPCASIPAARRRTPDPLIVAKEGDAPAYRGLAYVVFERLPLGEFRQPHSAAVVRGRAADRPARAHDARRDADPRHHRVRLRARPKSCRFSASARPRPRTATSRMRRPMSSPRSTNCRRRARTSSASRIVVAWFGDDLRAGHCAIEARRRGCRQESRTRSIWSVGGLDARDRASGLDRSTAGPPSAARRRTRASCI